MSDARPENSLRLLVVDDHAETAKYMQIVLSRAGYEVVTACDGPTALRHAATFGAQIVLMDLRLAGAMDGPAVARALADDLPGKPQLIAVTGFDDEEHRQRAQECGFSHYVLKPVVVSDLLSLLSTLKDGH